MTSEASNPDREATEAPVSLLPDPDLGRRVRQADFARIVGVSRTTVTRWRQDGVITVGPDGLLDPRKAARQVLDHIPPERLRAKVLRPLVNDQRELRRQIDKLTRERDYLEWDRDEWKTTADTLGEEADSADALVDQLRQRIAQLKEYAPPEIRAAGVDGEEPDDDEEDDDDGDDNDDDEH